MLLPGVRRPRNCSKMASEMKCFCQVVAQFVILSAFGGCNLRAQDQLDDSLRNIARCGGTVSRVGVPSRAIYVSFEAGDRPFDTARASTTSIDEGLTWLRNLPDLPGVSLSLKGVGIGDTTLVHIDGVGNLRELILENTGITDNGFSRLKELRNVNTLHLALNKKFTGVGFSGVKLPHLRDVSFFNDDLSNEGMRELAKFNTICRLELVGSQVTDVGLAHLKGLTELTQLTLMNNEIDGSGLGSLKALKHLCSLKVGGGDLTDRGMAGLGELTHLERLRIDSNNVSEVGFSHLRKLPGLRELILEGCDGLGDGGVSHLGDLRELHRLDISGRKITDLSLKHLAGLRNLGRLRLRNTSVSDDGLRELLKGARGLIVEKTITSS